jgi:hypothetical protein
MAQQYNAEEDQVNSSFHSTLDLHSSCLRQGKLRCHALHHPNESAFSRLFNSGQDDALVTMCGFDHAWFANLHTKFQIQFEKYMHYTSKDGQIWKVRTQRQGGVKKRRRPRLLSSIHCLGLALSWTRTQEGSYAVLQVIFGLTPGQLSRWLRFSRRLLVKVLRDDPLTKVTVPTDLEIRNFEAAIAAKYPALTNCWGAMDDLKLRLERAGDQRVQNMFYNGWTHDHYVSNLFLFSPDGKIRACYINAPDAFHDSRTMANMSMVYTLVDDIYLCMIKNFCRAGRAAFSASISRNVC